MELSFSVGTLDFPNIILEDINKNSKEQKVKDEFYINQTNKLYVESLKKLA